MFAVKALDAGRYLGLGGQNDLLTTCHCMLAGSRRRFSKTRPGEGAVLDGYGSCACSHTQFLAQQGSEALFQGKAW